MTKMSAISMMPAFSACTSSPVPGNQDDDRDVGGADDVDLVLADADGFDHDDVLAGCIEHERDIAGGAGEPAEVTTRGHAADEHALVAEVRAHPHAIAEDGAAGEGTRRIDGDDADRLSPLAELGRHPIDERALARARRACHANDDTRGRCAGRCRAPARRRRAIHSR